MKTITEFKGYRSVVIFADGKFASVPYPLPSDGIFRNKGDQNLENSPNPTTIKMKLCSVKKSNC